MKANLGPGSGTNKVVIKKGELVTKPFGTNGKKTHTRRAKSFKGSKGGLGI